MAISRKGNGSPPGVVLDRLPPLVRDIEAKKGDLEDAQMNHASVWKLVKDLGFNADPLKQVIKLRKMDATKRASWLADFYEYCRTLGVFAQPDLFSGDTVEQAAQAAAGAMPDEVSQAAYGKGREIGLAGDPINEDNFPEEERDAAMRGWTAGQAERVRLQMGDGGASEAPKANGDDEAPRRRGRPKGSADKTPRQRRSAAVVAAEGSAAVH